MFNFDTASLQITKEEILRYVTELQILERYCSNYKSLDSSFKSEFYSDKNASCRIVISATGIPYYRDFGNSDYYLAFDYVSRKFNTNYHETCNIIANDFNIKRSNTGIAPPLLIGVDDKIKLVKVKSNIQVIIKPFSIIDHQYWNQFGISLEILEYFNVKACSHVYLHKGDNHYIFEYKKNNPLYSYRFFKNNTEYFKIYNPYSTTKEGKWLSNVGSDALQGYDQLPQTGDLLIISKSLKDVMCLYSMGYTAVGLQAETNKISKKSFDELSKRFTNIVLWLDSDDQGYNSTGELLLKYDLPFIFIQETKDISDYCAKFGIIKSKKLIKNKLKCYI